MPKAVPHLKPLTFLGSSRDDLREMPETVRHAIGVELMIVQLGGTPTDFKPIASIGAGACEIRVRDVAGAFRTVYVTKLRVACLPEEVPEDRQVGSGSGEAAIQTDSRSEDMKSATRKPSRKTDARLADTRVIPGSGNVFVDLGFDEAEAQVMALRVQLMIRLRERLQEKGYTQVEAAKRLGMTQPRVSALLKGTWKDFSMDMLLTLATRAGLKPELRLAA